MTKNYIVILFLIYFQQNFAQNLDGQLLIDSLLVELPKMKDDTLKANLLNNLAYAYRDINADKHIKYANNGLKLSQKLNYYFGVVEAHRNIGVYYLGVDNLKSNKYFDYVLKNAKDKSQIAKAYFGKGFINSNESNFPQALYFYFKGLKFAEEAKNHNLYAKFLTNIGAVYDYSQETEKAISYYIKGLEYNKSHNNTEGDNLRLHHLAENYISLNQNDKALECLDKADIINNKLGLLKFKAACNDLRGDIFYWDEKYDLALEIYKKSLQINLSNGDKAFISKSYSNIAETYTSLAEGTKISANQKKTYLLEATKAIEKVISIDKETNDIRHLSSSLKTLSYIQKTQGNFETALATKDLAYTFKDSVFNSENKETIKNLEDKREIELRDNQIKINKLSLEAKEKQKWYLFGGLGLLTIIGGLLFYQSRKRKQINEKLQILNENLDTKNLELDQANKAKTRFFGILNHDLRGPVANLIFFLQLQKESPEMLDAESIKRMQDKTMTGAENLLASMEDILQWSKSQMENFKPQPKNVLVEQLFLDNKKVFSGYQNIKIKYQNPENIEIFTDDNYLKTIIRNLTNNAINAFTTTEKPLVIWKSWQENEKSFLSITDNGTGAEKEKFDALFNDSEVTSTKTGLGLHLIRDLATAINCEITVDSKIGVGTTFTLKL